MDFFIELGVIVCLAVIISIIMRLLKQPLMIGYILTGLIAGPYALNIIKSSEIITVFSHIGIAFLLFLVGLNLSPKVIKEVGVVSLVTGIGQVIFTSAIGFVIAKILGFSTITSAYISIALAFSSTIIIMKLLSDKGDTEKLYGKIAIGFLIVQDIIAIIILMLFSSPAQHSGVLIFVFETLIKVAGLLLVLYLTGLYLIPPITRFIAKSQELLLLFSISWALALSVFFYYLKFSLEVGALLAGITLSLSPYRYEIGCRMKPVRDFFLVMFFVMLGYQMGFTSIHNNLMPVIVFSLFVLIGNPLIVMTLMGLLGYTKRNGFLAGLTVAQISEFSLILIALGVKLGHIPNEMLSLLTAVGLITIAASAYMILYSDRIYPIISKYLNIFERKGKLVEKKYFESNEDYEIILFGYNRLGHDLLKSFKKLRKKFLVIDYNPEVILDLANRKLNCRYGDASDIELLNELNFQKVKMVVSTIPDFDTNLLLIKKIREKNRRAIVIVVSHQLNEALELYDKGASYVIMPHFLGGYHAATLIEKHGTNAARFIREKMKHIKSLNERKKLGHEHPLHERHIGHAR